MKRIAIFLMLLLAVIPSFARKHESGVTVTTDRFTNETTVKLKPFMLGGFKGGYKNNGWLELTASASFPNNQGYFMALVCHAQNWQFLKGVVVHVLADGQRIDLNFQKGSTRVQEDAWTLEILGTFPFIDSTTFDKMANAKVLAMEIGPYAFTFKPVGIQFLKDFSDAVKTLTADHSPSVPGQLSAAGPPPGNGALAPEAAARNGVLLFAYRTHAHVRYNKLEEFTGIVDDLISFLKRNGVPVVNDLIHRSVVTEQKTSTDTLVTYLQQIGARRLLLLTVDTPFTAKLKLILRCCDLAGKLLWEETVRENPFRELTAVAQATEELHKRLGYRMQELLDNETNNSTSVAVASPAAIAPDAAARKQFAQAVRENTVKKMGSELAPGFNITADGPNATIYVYHVKALTYPDCNSMFINKGMVSNLQKAGFTQFACTDDGNTRFTFNLTYEQPAPTQEQSQPVAKLAPGAADTPDAAARKKFVEEVRQRVVKDRGSNLSPDYNITAEGTDATIYVTHTPGVTYPLCKDMLTEDFVSSLASEGFRQLVCTGDGDTRFVFDLIAEQQSQSSRSASDALIIKPERPQPFGFHARMTQQEAIAAVGRSAMKAGYPKPMPYGSVLLLTTAPKPNSSFEDYVLKFSTEGLFEVWTHTPGIHSANDGAQVRDEFNELRNLIAGKYGEPKCFDFRDSGTSKRPDFFMVYLKDKEQHLSCTWNVGIHSEAILLEAESLDIDTAIIGVKYQFSPEFERAQAGADEKKKDSF